MTELDLEAVKARHEAESARLGAARISLDGYAITRTHADRAALISEVEALREALKPVAEFSAVFDRHVLGLSGREHESTPVATVHKWGGENQDVRIPVAHLYIGDLRRARAVLPETETEEKR
jgi:hypothetical protein